MLGFMSITAFSSMWITNMASTAIMLPIVNSMLEYLSTAEAEEEEIELQQCRALRTLQVHESKDGLGNIRM